MKQGKGVAIVGAGVGGLALAARLAHDGYDVDVFEKLADCGGRDHALEDKGFFFDMGPSFVLMPDFFEEVFRYCGRDIRDYVTLTALDPSYKIFFPDGDCITVHKDSEKTKAELERVEKGAGKGFDGFIKETAGLYKAVRPLLYEYFTLSAIMHPKYWGLLAKLKTFETYWGLARKYFKSDKLCYAFTFEAMFMGVSPFDAPAFYSIITYADHAQKIFHPMGGMYQIARALEKLAREFGARFHYRQEVKRIAREDGTLKLVFDASSQPFERVAVNADYAYTQTDLLQRQIPRYKYSCSVYLMYLGLKEKVPGLAHHNLFFAKDLRKNLRQIFKDKNIPLDPSFYVHVPTVTDPGLAPAGKDIWYILVPVPNLENPSYDFSRYELTLRNIVFEAINRITGKNTHDLIEVEHRFYPQDFISRYNIKHAATFGLAHNLMQSAFLRPANVDAKIPNLYYVGASTQPGGGLPVVIASSRIVADMIKKKDAVSA